MFPQDFFDDFMRHIRIGGFKKSENEGAKIEVPKIEKAKIEVSGIASDRVISSIFENNATGETRNRDRANEHIPMFCVFPNSEVQSYWTARLARTQNCISLDNYIILYNLQALLQKNLANYNDKPVRFLTMKESMYMCSLLIHSPHAQSLLRKVEGIDQGEDERVGRNFDTPSYVQKIRRLLAVLSVSMFREGLELTESLRALLYLYNELLERYQCSDTITLPTNIEKHFEKNPDCTSTPLFHIKIVFADLFLPDELNWMRHFGRNIVENSLTETANEPSSNARQVLYTYEEVVLAHNANFIEEMEKKKLCGAGFPAHILSDVETIKNENENMQLNPPSVHTRTQTKLHVYPSVGLELEAIFSSMRMLLERGMAAHDIMLCVCDGDEAIDVEIEDLAQKYHIPVEVQSGNVSLMIFLNLLDELVRTDFGVPQLHRFFFEPSILWRQRYRHIRIMQIATEHNIIDGADSTQWKELLEIADATEVESALRNNRITGEDDGKNPKTGGLCKYFLTLCNILSELVHAKSFLQMYKSFDVLLRYYTDYKISALGSYDVEEEYNNAGNLLLKEIELYLSLESYLQNADTKSDEKFLKGTSKSFYGEPMEIDTSVQTSKPNTSNESNKYAHLGERRYIKAPWKIFMSNISSGAKMSKKRNTIRRSVFPACIGSEYRYTFICNMNQRAVDGALSIYEYFNEYLTFLYKNEDMEAQYFSYKQQVLKYLSFYSEQELYMSTSKNGSQGANKLPSYWNVVRNLDISEILAQDIWRKEQSYWACISEEGSLEKGSLEKGSLEKGSLEHSQSAHAIVEKKSAVRAPSRISGFLSSIEQSATPTFTLDQLVINSSQRAGVEYQKKLGMFQKKNRIHNGGLDKELYTNIYNTREKKVSIRPSAIRNFLDTDEFVFAKVLGVRELIAPYDYDMLEQLRWGTMYHAILELGLSNEKNKSEPDKQAHMNILLDKHLANAHRYVRPMLKKTAEIFIEKFLPMHVRDVLELIKSKGDFKLDIETRVQTNMHELSKLMGLETNNDIISCIELNGRADILYRNAEAAYVLDYKMDNKSDRYLAYLFQIWLYNLMCNKNDYEFFSRVDGTLRDFGHIYFVFESDVKKRVLPQYGIEQGNRSSRKLSAEQDAQYFLDVCTYAIYRISEYYRKDAFVCDNDKIEKIYNDLVSNRELSISLIMREGSYVFV